MSDKSEIEAIEAFYPTKTPQGNRAVSGFKTPERKWDHEDCRHCKGKRTRKNCISGLMEDCPACCE